MGKIQTDRECKRCGDLQASAGKLYCTYCEWRVLEELKAKGYLEPVPDRSRRHRAADLPISRPKYCGLIQLRRFCRAFNVDLVLPTW
jgi:hypothetical protein